MGLTATMFGAYLGFQSLLANAADSLAMKAGRFVIAGGIPIVGGAVSDALGTVYTGLRLVKSAAGAVGIAALLLLFLPGLLQCLIYGFLCRGCAAAAQLLDNAPARGLLEGVADSIAMLQAVRVLYLLLTVLATSLAVLLNGGG
jgi:stage III sporulation protein AE